MGTNKLSERRGHAAGAPWRALELRDRLALVLLDRRDPRHGLEHRAGGGEKGGDLGVSGLHLTLMKIILSTLTNLAQIVVDVVQDFSLFLLQHEFLQFVLHIALLGRLGLRTFADLFPGANGILQSLVLILKGSF